MTCLDNHAVGYTVLSVCRSADISGDIFLNPFRNFYVLSPSSPELSMYKPVSLYLFITGDDPIVGRSFYFKGRCCLSNPQTSVVQHMSTMTIASHSGSFKVSTSIQHCIYNVYRSHLMHQFKLVYNQPCGILNLYRYSASTTMNRVHTYWTKLIVYICVQIQG